MSALQYVDIKFKRGRNAHHQIRKLNCVACLTRRRWHQCRVRDHYKVCYATEDGVENLRVSWCDSNARPRLLRRTERWNSWSCVTAGYLACCQCFYVEKSFSCCHNIFQSFEAFDQCQLILIVVTFVVSSVGLKISKKLIRCLVQVSPQLKQKTVCILIHLHHWIKWGSIALL